ncbi:RES family NAD+ phosphorylase [Scatolibacter rhodanostii]|uniref:RES family NAD+ phosphorylase n=1 Tax=Scatolibacter rhodanostii TaxID=2014781 RepID=UPI000C075FDC|nr:RES family NAD+ phosphorylase [Scatolibacter rhodanostii]
MNCCIECFQDTEIRAMISAKDQTGECSFCGSKDVLIYPVDKQTDLSDLISAVISTYEESDVGKPLFQVLLNDWSIFNPLVTCSNKLLEAFCLIIFGDSENSHNVKVRIPRSSTENYGILGGHTWQEFSTNIKNENRFHNGFFKADRLATFLTYAAKRYAKDTLLYRARIWSDNKGFCTKEMGVPPFDKRRSGRVNPEGICALYLSSKEETAISEVRANAFDFVSVGKFRLLKNISIINLSKLNNISPAIYSAGLESLTANISIFRDISEEISKPLRRNDSHLDYLPTQYITEFIKSKGYAGIEFSSTRATSGDNIAVFDESLFKCESVHNFEIEKIEHTYKKL